MASAYIGFACEGDASSDSVAELKTALGEIRRSADKVTQLLVATGLRDTIERRGDDLRAASLNNLSQIRAYRDRVFGDEIFFDPAWNMLLDLYQRELEGRRVMVSDACNASGGPPTTGLRWLKVLEARGYVVRMQDPNDKRRIFVKLSDHASAHMAKITDTIVNKFYEV